MPDTLQFYYDPHYRPNRRRPKHPILQALLRLILWIVALMVIIGVLIKFGIIQDPERGRGLGILAQCGVAVRSA